VIERQHGWLGHATVLRHGAFHPRLLCALRACSSASKSTPAAAGKLALRVSAPQMAMTSLLMMYSRIVARSKIPVIARPAGCQTNHRQNAMRTGTEARKFVVPKSPAEFERAAP
jgi:hypothetical protein